MIRIGILGDIGSGKSYVAKGFGCPVFNADQEVAKLYKKNRKTFHKLKKNLPKFIYSFPINKNEIINAIIANKINLKKITKVIHSEIRKEMIKFLKRHINRKIVILDIPLLLENKINKKGDILVFVKSNKKAILKKLKKIIKIVHLEIRKKMYSFLKKNRNKKFVILDIPLLLENKINQKKDILVFVQSKKKDILQQLSKRNNYNKLLLKKFRYLQLSLDYKRRKSHFIIKNNFTKKSIKKGIKEVLKEIKI